MSDVKVVINDEALTPIQVAKILKLDYDSVQRMLRRRQIPSFPVGSSTRHRRVWASVLYKWTKERENLSPEAQRRATDRRRK